MDLHYERLEKLIIAIVHKILKINIMNQQRQLFLLIL